MNLRKLMKSLWVRALQKGTVCADKKARFDQLYWVDDPWKMGSDTERFRFQEINRIIENEMGGIDSLLEIGCGEGHQTEYLSRLCRRIYGFDVSKTAVGRAKKRCPEAHLSEADVFSYRPELRQFDLVVACEILYYLKDVPAALERMNELGARCLVSYFQSSDCNLDAYFKGWGEINNRVIETKGVSWKIVWWDSRILKSGKTDG